MVINSIFGADLTLFDGIKMRSQVADFDPEEKLVNLDCQETDYSVTRKGAMNTLPFRKLVFQPAKPQLHISFSVSGWHREWALPSAEHSGSVHPTLSTRVLLALRNSGTEI